MNYTAPKLSNLYQVLTLTQIFDSVACCQFKDNFEVSISSFSFLIVTHVFDTLFSVFEYVLL